MSQYPRSIYESMLEYSAFPSFHILCNVVLLNLLLYKLHLLQFPSLSYDDPEQECFLFLFHDNPYIRRIFRLLLYMLQLLSLYQCSNDADAVVLRVSARLAYLNVLLLTNFHYLSCFLPVSVPVSPYYPVSVLHFQTLAVLYSDQLRSKHPSALIL